MKIKCWRCENVEDVPATAEQIADWKSGTLIQKAMPDISIDLREMLISRTCPQCWIEVMKEPA